MSWRAIAAIVGVRSSMTYTFTPSTRRLTFVEFSHTVNVKAQDITLCYAFDLVILGKVASMVLNLWIP